MSRTQNNPGRLTPKGTRPQLAATDVSGIRSSTHPPSPKWMAVLIGVFLALGSLVIFANYLSGLPGSPDNIWLFVGLGGILAGIVTATRYH